MFPGVSADLDLHRTDKTPDDITTDPVTHADNRSALSDTIPKQFLLLPQAAETLLAPQGT